MTPDRVSAMVIHCTCPKPLLSGEPQAVLAGSPRPRRGEGLSFVENRCSGSSEGISFNCCNCNRPSGKRPSGERLADGPVPSLSSFLGQNDPLDAPRTTPTVRAILAALWGSHMPSRRYLLARAGFTLIEL